MTMLQREKFNIPEAEKRGITHWRIWEKGPSHFSATYDSKGDCSLLKGEFTVETKQDTFRFGSGDFVVFPAGLECIWNLSHKVKKHYNFPA